MKAAFLRPGPLGGLTLAIALTGCYTFQPIDPGPIEPGTTVRAHLDGRGVRAPSGGLLLRDAVEGHVVRADQELLALQVTIHPDSPIQRVRTSTVEIPWAEVRYAEQKTLDRTRTGVFVGGASLVAGFIIVRLFQQWSGGGTGDGGGNGAEMGPGW
jgi:hypothetical protein